MQYLALLGRQPELSIAEIESFVGPSNVNKLTDEFALVDKKIDVNALGGTIKTAQVNDTVEGDLSHALEATLPIIEKRSKQRGAKLNLGFSVYGERTTPKKLSRSLLELKKQLRAKSVSLRLVPNKKLQLNSAQVIHNKLTSDKGMELIIIKDGKQYWIATTLAEQNIDAFTIRDRSKPVRDTYVGMLPPKLALIMINLASLKSGETVLDPFCGTGTILLEAMNQDMNAVGSDISTDMVNAASQNTDWFKNAMNIENSCIVDMADATKHHWLEKFDAVVAETFLGPPLRSIPPTPELNRIIKEVDALHREFLLNLAAQIKNGTKVVLAVPSWQNNKKSIDLPLLDDLENLGYTRSSFIHAGSLLYNRPSQTVGRRLLVLIRK